jgi:hypothetical protein
MLADGEQKRSRTELLGGESESMVRQLVVWKTAP